MKITTFKVINYLEHRSKLTIFFGGLLLALIIGIIDYGIIPNFSLALFYLLPIILVIWFGGIWSGLSICIFSTFSWLINDFKSTAYSYPHLRFYNTIVRLIFFVSIVYLVTALKTSYDREKLFARTDELTGIGNRRYFFDSLQRELNLAWRYHKTFSVAYFDIDNFKTVNDRYGHNRGDELLKLVATTTAKTIRQVDIVARLGGDEFALLFLETNFDASHIALQRLRTNLLDTMKRHSFAVTFSMGAITFSQPPNSVNEILQTVDRLMYEVKRSGKNNLNHELYNVSSG